MDCSEEEIRRCFEFVKKLQQADDKSIFHQCVTAMEPYRFGSATYTDIKHRLVSILSNNEGLFEEFHQFLSDSASPVRKNYSKKEKVKSDVERTVEFLNKIEALGETVYKAFVGALAFPGDIKIMVEQLEDILGDHTSLKDEFETFLIDSGLLKRKHDLETVVTRPAGTEDTHAN